MWKRLPLLFLVVLAVTGCQRPGQNAYSAREMGRGALVNFGTVVAVREVAVIGENTGTGAGIGAVTGGIAGSRFGSGGGNVAATLGGMLAGAIVGAVAEQAMSDRTGLEYTVTLENGATMTVLQERNEGDRMLPPGSRVMVQVAGGHQRVLPADHLPTEIQRPQGIRVLN
ncbi:MAG TPA: hypothetical protein VEY95_17040 [Azospirillaceae bacterium]|nr:hypothetical protein [Azospirillaceae bacterium]